MSAATSKKSNSRAKGRPDADDTVGREALLAAAIEELRVSSPESLTLAGVAARAGVHPALIRYYFGNKDKLLREVVKQLVDQGQESARSTMESSAPLEDKLAGRLQSMIDLIHSNPHFHRLVLDKIYGQGNDGDGEDLLGQIATRGMRLTVSLLHDQPSRPVRPIDPRFLHVAMIGLTEFFVAAKPLLHELFGENADIDELKSRYVSFVTDLILHGISAGAPATPSVVDKSRRSGR
ncbi:TetR/AcrR family transcriptional regulator [Pusillimonas caeni]|uniref:TetR/AcrR family transcriptional regulator n=1 Tax=Pusillimonas caeni TaxID=1348472 RepID=UPI000E59D2AC|nr:TetR/AcrR family transcriptional regulator [Pusillimonas caeni]TFL14714.1 TetR/AcrR family transcriptional regulator [Pusillimonas caeni]